jgi:hypothetical protein
MFDFLILEVFVCFVVVSKSGETARYIEKFSLMYYL